MVKGFACGVFDLYHPGHAIMLEECKRYCDYLVVALNSASNLSADKNPPIFTIDERVLILNSIKYVDEVIVYNSEAELENILVSRDFNVRFLGDDYRDKEITAKDVIPKLIFLNRDHGYSTSRLREQIINQTNRLI